MAHADAEVAVAVAGAHYPLLVRTPAVLAAHPGVLIHLALDARAALDTPPHAILPLAFLAAGHRVATFDLPNHGGRVDELGDGLIGMAAAMAAGRDVVADLVAMGQAAVDACQSLVDSEPGRIVLSGISRGGFYALHLFAGERRIAAAATFAPVTNLLALREFEGLDEASLVGEANTLNLVPHLADRPTFCAIKTDDPRVRTADCVAFYRALQAAASDPSDHTLRLEPGDNHTISDDAYVDGAVWLLARLGAERSRTETDG